MGKWMQAAAICLAALLLLGAMVWRPGQAASLGESRPWAAVPIIGNPTPTATTCVWRELFFEGFEGGFPDAWRLADPHPEDGEHRWAKRNCRPFAGSYSAWAVGGGETGAALACGSAYPNNATSWMIFGPISLDQAERAELTFMRWLNLERWRDQLFYGASTDGVNFYGSYISDDEQTWEQEKLDLADVPGLGSLIGRRRIWIGFAFLSDGLCHKTEGVYIDNVLIRACGLVRTYTPTPTATGARLTPTVTPTPTVTCPCIILNPHPYYAIYLPLLLKSPIR